MLVQMLLGAFARSTSCSSSSFLSESDPADHSTKISEDESSCSGCWSSSSEEEEVEYNGERIQLPVSIHGRLNYDIYERIIDATLSSLSFFNPSPPPAPPSENDDDDEDGQATAIRFLRTCCLVNSTFESIARRRLYASTKYNAMTLRRALKSSPHLATYVKRFTLDARIIISAPITEAVLDHREWAESEEEASSFLAWDRNAADLLTSFPLMPNLESLSVCENPYSRVNYLYPSPRYVFAYPSTALTHLEYHNGSPILLTRLLSHLPHLTTLHVGRMHTSSSTSTPVQAGGGGTGSSAVSLVDQLGGQGRIARPCCRLRQLVLQSISHFTDNLEHLDFLFGSSIDSLQVLKMANCPTSLLRDLLPIVTNVKALEMTVKERSNFAFIEEVELDDVLSGMPQLEKVSLHARDDYRLSWPGPEHRALEVHFPKVTFSFHQGEVSFM